MSMSLLSARYGKHDAPDQIALNQIVHTLLSHRSVRNFLPDALPAGTLETLVAAAQSAPTSSNMQTWSVVAVLHRERYDAAAEASAIARYDETLAVFSRSQRMEADSWTGSVIDRVGTKASLRGRHQMRDVLNALGFGLR